MDNKTGDEKTQTQTKILDYLGEKTTGILIEDEPETCRALRILRNFLKEHPAAQKRAFVDKVRDVFENGEKVSSATKLADFISARRQEGIATADIVLTLADELGSNKRFSTFLRLTTVAGNFIDTFLDARSDAKDSRISINPTRLQFGIAKEALTGLRSVYAFYPGKIAKDAGRGYFLYKTGGIPKYPPGLTNANNTFIPS
ncbi:MAG: hypothetical protein PHW76_00165 [Alphaproteobacteria bacterium]|nr:hypothetical protein [Alphaproteobacteria bacterium]